MGPKLGGPTNFCSSDMTAERRYKQQINYNVQNGTTSRETGMQAWNIRPNDTKQSPIIIRPPRAIAHVAMSSELHYPLTVDPSAPKTTSTQTDRYSCTKWLDTWGRKGGGGTEQEGEMQRHSKVRRIIEPPRAIAHVATSWIRSPHTPASCSDPPRTNTCESWKKIGSQPFSNAV